MAKKNKKKAIITEKDGAFQATIRLMSADETETYEPSYRDKKPHDGYEKGKKNKKKDVVDNPSSSSAPATVGSDWGGLDEIMIDAYASIINRAEELKRLDSLTLQKLREQFVTEEKCNDEELLSEILTPLKTEFEYAIKNTVAVFKAAIKTCGLSDDEETIRTNRKSVSKFYKNLWCMLVVELSNYNVEIDKIYDKIDFSDSLDIVGEIVDSDTNKPTTTDAVPPSLPSSSELKDVYMHVFKNPHIGEIISRHDKWNSNFPVHITADGGILSEDVSKILNDIFDTCLCIDGDRYFKGLGINNMSFNDWIKETVSPGIQYIESHDDSIEVVKEVPLGEFIEEALK